MKKSLLALILVLCLGFAMVFTSCGEETETFTNGRISIDLPLYFSDEDLEDGSVLFYTPVVGVKTYSLTESEFRAAYSYTGDSISLSTFANCYAEYTNTAKEQMQVIIDEEKQMLSFSYAASEDDVAYNHYFYYVFLKDNCFFIIAMSCDDDHIAEYDSKFIDWAESIRID